MVEPERPQTTIQYTHMCCMPEKQGYTKALTFTISNARALPPPPPPPPTPPPPPNKQLGPTHTHTHREECNVYWFPTEIMVSRTRLGITFYVHRVPCRSVICDLLRYLHIRGIPRQKDNITSRFGEV